MNWFAKKVFDRGGGKHLKNRCKSTCYLSKFFNFVKIKKIVSGEQSISSNRCTEKIQPAGTPCRGSILIEFAICMPVLIILLFYIHDLVKIKRYYSQTEFVAQQMVNIIQNISQKRDNRKITQMDLRYAASLACLSLYPGTTMYLDKTATVKHPLYHHPRINIFYIKRLAEGKATCSWIRRMLGETASDPKSWSFDENASSKVTAVRVNNGAEVAPSDIYPTLKLEDKDKIILECTIYATRAFLDPNIVSASENQSTVARKAFKCRLLTPKPLQANPGGTDGWYFSSVVIFTPKDGLFDPDNPPTD